MDPNAPLQEVRLERMLYWITERESVRKKKEAGEPKPWSVDPVFQSTRFCNVRRMDDKVSQWLLKNWYVPFHDVGPAQSLANAAMARLINWPDSLTVMAEAELNTRWSKKRALNVLNDIKATGKLFTGVYIINGIAGQDKVTTVVNQFDDVYHHAELVDSTSMQRTHKNLQGLLGFGSFISGQVVADLRHVWPGTWADRIGWAPLGPGSRRGIAWLQGWDGVAELPSLKQSDFLIKLREMIVWLLRYNAFRDVHFDRHLEWHDLQNCLCEYDKMMRISTGVGKGRNGYPGV